MKSLKLYFLICSFALCGYSELPSNLLPTGWIESKGGWISTGISQQNANTVVIDCVMDVSQLSTGSRRLMGFYNNGINNNFGITTGNSFEINKNSTLKANLGLTYHIRFTQDSTTSALEIYEYNEGFSDETLLERIENSSNGMGTSECQVFTVRSSSSYVCKGVRIRSFQITIDNNLVSDLVPVYDTNEGKPGMYDNIRETTLLGTGRLICEKQEIFYGSGIQKFYCDEGTMYFPSYMEFDNLNDFNFPEGTVLQGTEDATLTVGQDILDMHTIFGAEMENGTKYQIEANYPFGLSTNFYICKSANVPSLHIYLDNKDINFLHASKRNTDSGTLIKINPDGTKSKVLTVKKIGGRGNTSWDSSGSKRPYKINLNDKFALIDGSAKNKKFMIIPVNMDNADHSGLREYIAHELGDSIGMSFTPDMEFADIYLNGSYRGFYLIKERVTINKDRVNINEPEYDYEDEEFTTRIIQKNGIKGIHGDEGDADDHAPYRATWDIPDATETIRSENDDEDPALKAGIQAYQYASNSIVKEGIDGGFVIEMNVSYYVFCRDEHIFFVTRRGQLFSMKTPEVATKEQVQRIAIFVQEFEDALFDTHGINSKGKHYSQYIDVDSMAKRIFIDGFLLNYNFALNSTFFYIDADPATGDFIGKLISEPIWDYDDYTTFSSTHLYFNVGYEMHYVPQFFNKSDFIKALYEIQTTPNGFTDELTRLNTSKLIELKDRLTVTYQLNNYRFGTDSLSDANKVLTKMSSRTTSWNNIWSQSTKLLGAWIEMNMNRSANPSLSVETYGTAISYQWYKQEADSNELVLLEDEDSSTIDPMQHGRGQYVCGVYGRNVEQQAGGNYVTMYTEPYDFTLPEPGMFFLIGVLFFIRKQIWR
jgi:hypothetical protein